MVQPTVTSSVKQLSEPERAGVCHNFGSGRFRQRSLDAIRMHRPCFSERNES